MKIETKYAGTINIEEKDVLTFEQGLPAFEEETSFILHPFDQDTPFFVLQSTTSVEIAFILVNPFDFVVNYQVKLSDSTIEALDINKQEDVATYVMLTVKEPFVETTANLQGPIVINISNQKAKQILLSDSEYKTKHLIFKEAVTIGKEEK
ncbi:flagellar assembly protein FliW [Bacillus suaedae]|uniref:Flagellar assembly factor FliW n=1 Tax=Halalkalibacter suaedae TaxID=2822140 RepID=A0A941AN85_9BACI|nr:flagellar assembly protein FliW [Bacillus suaedae]MBP3950037.1 flagellar assembly protein FliW [Bacillus suaedae]